MQSVILQNMSIMLPKVKVVILIFFIVTMSKERYIWSFYEVFVLFRDTKKW